MSRISTDWLKSLRPLRENNWLGDGVKFHNFGLAAKYLNVSYGDNISDHTYDWWKENKKILKLRVNVILNLNNMKATVMFMDSNLKQTVKTLNLKNTSRHEDNSFLVFSHDSNGDLDPYFNVVHRFTCFRASWLFTVFRHKGGIKAQIIEHRKYDSGYSHPVTNLILNFDPAQPIQYDRKGNKVKVKSV